MLIVAYGDELKNILGNTRFPKMLGKQTCRQHRFLGRFENDAVAGHQSGKATTRGNGIGKVPWRSDKYHA